MSNFCASHIESILMATVLVTYFKKMLVSVCKLPTAKTNPSCFAHRFVYI
jgi:hypothetical protein